MKTIYTVHHHYIKGRFGFESSQQTRIKFIEKLGLDYVHLVTAPRDYDFNEYFRSIGFSYGEYINLPEYYLGDFVSKEDGIYSYENGYAKYSNKINSYTFWIKEEVFTEEDFVVKYLAEHSNEDDVIFRDDSRLPMRKLFRFCENCNRIYYEVIHNKITENGSLPVLNKKVHYIAASELLTEDLRKLGYKVDFFPPMCIDEIKWRDNRKVKKYLWSGHLGDYKRFDVALRIMKDLEDMEITLDVYGGTKEEFDRYCKKLGCIPKNVNYKGFIIAVPYWEYDGYLSTSVGEVFANSSIEAMKYGLKCICSDIRMPYLYYNVLSFGEFEVCSDISEYVSKMKYWSDNVYEPNGIRFIEKYKFDNWVGNFKKLIERK